MKVFYLCNSLQCYKNAPHLCITRLLYDYLLIIDVLLRQQHFSIKLKCTSLMYNIYWWLFNVHVMSLYMCVRNTLSWCEHGGVQQSSLKPSASPWWQVRCFIPFLWFAVCSLPYPCRGNNSSAVWITVSGLMVGTAMMVAVMRPLPVAMVRVLSVSIVAVGSTVYLENDGPECDKETNTDATQKHQRCPLRLV